jgi:hypothetical protein
LSDQGLFIAALTSFLMFVEVSSPSLVLSLGFIVMKLLRLLVLLTWFEM